MINDLNDLMLFFRFPLDDTGNTMTVVQYFREKYNVNLRHVLWPSLLVGSESKPTYLPMEVCPMTYLLCWSPRECISLFFFFIFLIFNF